MSVENLDFASVRDKRDLSAALEYFDSLPAVTVAELIGSWRGSGFETGHPMDGLLDQFSWRGKQFDSPDAVHPLVLDLGGGRTGRLNPALVPTGLLARFPGLGHHRLVKQLFVAIRPLLLTRKPTARLMMTEYRGVVSATMCYNALPIHDIFRRVDSDVLLGISELPGFPQPLFFVLRRDG